MSFKRVVYSVLVGSAGAGSAAAQPAVWQVPASAAMEKMTALQVGLLALAAAVLVLVAGVLLAAAVRFNARAHPEPSGKDHNALFQTALVIVPVLLLAAIGGLSWQFADVPPAADISVRVTGHGSSWTYVYPGEDGFQFDSTVLADSEAKARREPRQLGVDNPMVVPVDKVVEVDVSATDVVHTWAVPALGVRVEAVPGRHNRFRFRATKPGSYYGSGPEPVEVKVVSAAAYDEWLNEARGRFAGLSSIRVAWR